MEHLVAIIMVWLSVSVGLPDVTDQPKIRYLPPEQVAALYDGRLTAQSNDDILAVYDDATRTIILRPDWDSNDIADVSVLVHELVHHMQNGSGLHYPCAAEREALAFEAQGRWLQLFGQTLDGAFGIDGLTLLVKTTCMH